MSPFHTAPLDLVDRHLWYACRTRARAEKKVDRLLTAAGVTSYVPLIERLRKWSDRSKQVTFPLFPGYVFARFSLSSLPEIVRTPNLIEVVRVNGSPTPIRESEIESIRSLVLGAHRIGEEPSAHDYLVSGQEVRVIQGPFEGLRGILTQVRGKTRIVVRLEAIRQAVSVEMASHFVLPVTGP
ncbi:MAG TPA: UpxY family transcription antiterminator [Gemmatimonadota bacterium]|nr:UpxY family transcription antiterminator [Gemmatimonadota bacterium]